MGGVDCMCLYLDWSEPKMRTEHIVECCVACFAFLFISDVIWKSLELIVYGEIQPRVVDDLMGVVFLYGMWKAYLLGRKHGKGG